MAVTDEQRLRETCNLLLDAVTHLSHVESNALRRDFGAARDQLSAVLDQITATLQFDGPSDG